MMSEKDNYALIIGYTKKDSNAPIYPANFDYGTVNLGDGMNPPQPFSGSTAYNNPPYNPTEFNPEQPPYPLYPISTSTSTQQLGFEGLSHKKLSTQKVSNMKRNQVEDEFYEETKREPKRIMFRDGKRKIDYVLAYEPNDTDEVRRKNRAEKREQFENNLKHIGLQLEREDIENSADGKTVFVKLHIPWKLMCEGAEETKMKMSLKEHELDIRTFSERLFEDVCCCQNPFELNEPSIIEEPNCYTCAFRRDRQDKFIFPENKEDFFTSVQRSRVVHRILSTCRYDDRKQHQMGIRRLLANRSYTAAYTLHEGSYETEYSSMTNSLLNDRQLLHQHWGRPGRWFKEQPLDLIRKYFGEKIGLYFTWLGYYTGMLIPAALVGLTVVIYGLATMNSYQPIVDLCDQKLNFPMCPKCDTKCKYSNLTDSCVYGKVTYMIDNNFTVVFAVFMSLWATFFLEFWKRRQAEVQYDWDLIGYEDEEEQPRPEFVTKVTTLRLNPITQLEEPYLPNKDICPRYTVAFNCVLFMIILVIVAILSVVVYRIAIYAAIATTSSVDIGWVGLISSSTGAILNLIAIMLLNKIYERLAYFLTEWEMPKTQTMFDDLFTFKMYLFQFFNFYGSLFYIAFLKLDPGTPEDYNRIFGFRKEECNPAGCLFELGLQLFVIMIGKQVFNNIIEVAIPVFKNWWHGRDNKNEVPDTLSQWEKDYYLVEPNPQGLFYEYLEMVIQFGFITIFVAAFPLGPLFALLNNLIEIRVDSYKFVSIFRRPLAERTQDIGIWSEILSGVAKLSVVVNAFTIGFVSEFVPRLYYKLHVSEDSSMTGFLNSTLSCFEISDYDRETKSTSSFTSPNGSCGFGKQTCRYRGHYEDPYMIYNDDLVKNPRAYEFSQAHWHIIAGRLFFVVAFEHFVFFVSNFVAWVIPDIPYGLNKQIKRENYLAKEAVQSEIADDQSDTYSIALDTV